MTQAVTTDAHLILAAEGGYQEFTLGGAEWAWLLFSVATALLAIAVGFFLCRASSPPTRAPRR